MAEKVFMASPLYRSAPLSMVARVGHAKGSAERFGPGRGRAELALGAPTGRAGERSPETLHPARLKVCPAAPPRPLPASQACDSVAAYHHRGKQCGMPGPWPWGWPSF